MKRFSAVLLGLVVGAGTANAADYPDAPLAPAAIWSWTGLYIGAHLGAGFGNSQFPDAAGPAIYGGSVRSPAASGGVQAGYNWQAPNTSWVLGVEADISTVQADGTNTCFASSGFFISANCQVRQSAIGTVTGRLGYAAGVEGKTLIYAKGGAALLDEQIGITTGGVYPAISTSTDGTRWGWTLGAGVEQMLAPAWSVRLEYDYANFGSTNVATPASYLQVLPPLNFYSATPGGTSSVRQDVHTVKLGLNIRLGEDAYARWEPAASDYALRGSWVPDVQVEFGARAWYSSGKFQKDLGATPLQAQQALLNSRLTYESTAASGELFGRIDGYQGIFVKGFIGGGSLGSGKMHDEDWVIFNDTVPYSNTVSNPLRGDLAYGTLDAGWAFLTGDGFKVGGFVGYNIFSENKSAYGCTQIANQNSDCVPALSNTILGITENDRWNSFRMGVNGIIGLAPGLSLNADLAYLPFVTFRGVDNHLLRTDVADTVSPEKGTGQGVQLEAILSYTFNNSFSIGAGGRYWAMWSTNADTNIFGTSCPCQTLPVRTERYGAFVQASYKIGGLK